MQSNNTQQRNRKCSPFIQWMRAHLKTPVTALLLASMVIWTGSNTSLADTLYKQNTGANTTLDTATFTPTAPGAVIQNYAEGTAFTAGDIIAFNNAITAATTFRVSNTTGTNLQVGGLVVGTPFLGSVLNPGAAITIQNGAGASGSPVANTLTLGASGIDMLLASQNLTISSDTTNGSSLAIATSANQIWNVGNGRTLTLGAGTTLSNNITIQGNGTTTVTGAISGAGNITLQGNALGGSVLTLGGNNSAWTGSLTVEGNSLVNIDNFVTAGQNRLNTASTLTLNRGRVDLTNNASAQTQAVAALALGQGLNTLTRTSTNNAAKLEINNATITRGTGAIFAVNGASLGTTAAPTTAANSPLIVDTLNTNGILGTWAVNINGSTDTNWLVNGPNTANGGVVISSAVYTTNNALDTWTTATQNILVNAATTASTASRTINSLKILPTVAGAITIDIGAANTLTINDGQNGGGIIRVGNNTTQVGTATPGQGFLTAGGIDDSINDTLHIYNSQSTMTINNVIKNNNTGVGTDTLHLVLGGAGSVTLNAANTFTGGITIAAGALNLGNNNVNGNAASLGTGAIVNHGTLLYDKTAAATVGEQTISNNISGVGAFTVNRNTAILSGNNTFQGITTIAANAILKAGSSTGISPNSRIILNTAGTGTLDLNGFDVSVAALRGDQSANRVLLGANTLTITGSDLSSNTGTAGLLQSQVTQNYQGTIEGTGNVIKNGAMGQVFTAGGAVSYTGTTTVNGGFLQANKALATSGVTVNNSTPTVLGANSAFISNIANSLATTASVSLAHVGSTWQINNGFDQSIGSLSGVTDSRVFLQGGAGNIAITLNDNSGGTFTFNGVINAVQGAGVGSVIKDGNHTWVLGGGNSFGGGLTINNGIVQVAVANPVGVLGDTTPVTLADVAGATLDGNGNSLSFGSLAGGGTTGGAVTLGAAGSLALGYNNTSTSFGGVISGGTAGTTNLTKVGTGTQTLTGANTFVGNVVIGNLGGQSGGGLTIGVGGTLADTVSIRNAGWNTTLTVNNTDTVAAVTGTRNTTLAIGTGAVLTSTYTNGTATALAATADSASANGRIIRGISTAGLKPGDLITGTGVTAASYVVQVISDDMVLVNQVPPAGPTVDFIPTVTATSVLNSAITGLGGFTKDGTGLLILTGASTNSGVTTINNGDVQVGGIWNNQKFSLHDTLSDASQFNFSAVNTTNLNFANNASNLTPFERVGSLAGGAGATTSINLLAGGNVAALAFGGNNDTGLTYSGRIIGANAGTWLIKEGTGTFTWNNPTATAADIFDGTIVVDGGTFTTTGANGLDTTNNLLVQNNGSAFTSSVSANDTFAILQGGGKGASRVLANGTAGGLQANYITDTPAVITLTTAAIRLTTSSSTSSVFGGVIAGAGNFTKEGSGTLELRGANTYTGETLQNGGTLRMGIYSASAGLGTPSAGGNGTLAAGSSIRSVTGTLDINGTTQTVSRFAASSTGGTIQLVNGSLTLANQNTQSTATVITGTTNSILNINAAAASTLTMTGNSNAFNGTYNVGTNAALTVNLAAGVLGDAARLNLNGTGTQLTVTLADTVGSLAGTGNAVLTQALTIREGWSGTYDGAGVGGLGYSGAASGAGALILSNYGGLTLSGNNANTGGVTISSGALLNLSYGAGNNILHSAAGSLTLNGGRIAVFSTAASPTILESVASTSLNAGASSVESWANHAANYANQQLGGNGGLGLTLITRALGGTINFGANAASTTSGNNSGILGGVNTAYATFDGATWAVANGATTAISGLATAGYAADGIGAGVHNDVSAGTGTGTAATIRFNGAAAVNQTGALTLDMGGILVTKQVGANTSTISGALNATANELIIHQYNPHGDLVLTNVGGTNTAITTAGGGKTLITNDIGGTGVTNVGNGYLQLGDTTAGGSTTGMVGSGNVLVNGTLGINRSNAVGFSTAIISGTGNLEQLGTGTTTLGAANTFQGRVTVRGGTLEITNNAGLGAAATAATNRAANLTSVNTGGTLLMSGGVTAVTEVLNLDGGTLRLGTTAATTLAAPIILNSDSTIDAASGAGINHIISGEIYALPGSDLTITNSAATTSTIVLAPTATTGARWENTTVNAGGRLLIGNNTRGFIGTGNITNNGTLTFDNNDAHYVVDNTITGNGTLAVSRRTTGNTYFTGDLSGFTGTFTVATNTTVNANTVAEIGNDTYNNGFGTGPITITSGGTVGTSGIASLRSHLNQDITLSNTITLTPATDGTNAKSAQFIRAGLGNMTMNGTLVLGATNAAPGTQRNQITTDGGGKLFFNATLSGAGANNILNITNNNILVMGGSASQSYHGVLGGNNTWIFDNTGTTTLLGVNSFNTGNSYLRKGTLVVGTGAVDTIHNDNDMHILRGATLSVVGNETTGILFGQRGATVNIATGATLTLDDNQAGMFNGDFTGAGNLTLGNYMVMYGTSTATGTLTLGTGTTAGSIQTANLTNAIGSFSTINLGAAANTGAANLEYVGPGETFANNLNLSGTTAAVRITANGNGALTLSGNITNTGAGNKTLTLSGQTGGYFNAYKNTISGAITEGANVLTLAMPNTANDDRFGVTSYWRLQNANNDFSGNITVNVGMLEFNGDLGTGGGATSVMGDLTATRTITLGSNNFDGRRYDMFGSGDQIGDTGFSQGINTLTPAGDVGTIIFNDPNAGTATLGANISWSMVNTSTANTTGAQLINNGVKQIIINGTFATNTTGAHNIVLDGSNTTSNTINSVLANPVTSQATAVIKEGSGTWRLGGANTYTGGTTINNGILELSGGAAIADNQNVNVAAAGGDGLYSGSAKLKVVASETIGSLQGAVGGLVEIDAGQTLTISDAASQTFSGVISGSGNLTRTLTGGTARTQTLTNVNTYSGVTTLGSSGTSTASSTLVVYNLADGGVNSAIGSSGNAANNLVFTANTAVNQGGILTWQGFTSQSTDRLFTVADGTAGARINAAGQLIGTNAAALTFSNTGALAYSGTGTRTLTLGGGTVVDNVFRPQITNNTGATTLSKVDAGIWLINPDVAGNTYTGGTSITGGTLAIQAGNALGTGTITINGGGGVGLEVRSGITLANAITNSAADGGFRAVAGNSTFTGLVTLTAQTRVAVDSGASIDINNATSAMTGAGTLLKFGRGNLTLSGVNGAGWTGATTVRNGTLTLEYGVNDNSKLADGGVLTLGGIGGLTTTGVDNDVAGQTNIFGQRGGAVHLSGGTHAETVLSTTFDTGSNAITRAGGSTATINLNVLTRASSGGTVDFGAASIATTDTNDVNGILGVGYATVAKADWAHSINTGAANTAITAIAAYNVDTYGAANNVDVTTYAGVGTAANTLRFNNNAGGTLTLGGTFAMTGGGLLVTPNVNAGNVIITGGAIQNAASTAGLEALIIHQHSTTNALQIDSVIQNNTNAQALTKTGAGTLYLGGVNQFTGNVNLYEGIIQVGGTAAAPTTATNAFLSGQSATPAANAAAAWQLAEGSTLRFLTTNTTIYNTPLITGGGTIDMAAGNQGVLLFDDNNTDFYGTINFNGGTIRVGNQANALGNIRGLLNVNGNVNFLYTAGITSTKVTNYSEGTTVNFQNNTTTSTATWAGTQNFNNTTLGGLNFNIPAPTTNGTVGLNVSGLINASNGFTKSGNGILQLSAVNFKDVYAGFASANMTPSLLGQVAVTDGILYVGNARALGATGAGNETVVSSGASVDLRGAALNYNDDSDASREIFKIQGTGHNGTGALRNSTGTGQAAFLTLDGNATINSGGTEDASAMVIGSFDTNLQNGNSLTGAFTRNRPVIAGGGFDLSIQGGRNGTDNLVFVEPTFSSALGSMIISEGNVRFRHEITAALPVVGVTSTDITNGITIGYAGTTLADLNEAIAGNGANVGSRLYFENYFGLGGTASTHNTVDITMDGVAAAAASGTPGGARSLAGGANYLQVAFGTIPNGQTYFDGDIALTGTANRNILISDSSGNYSVVEQGNTTVSAVGKMIIGGQITGLGGFSKIGFGETRLTANNTFSGDLNVLRFGTSSSPFQSNTVRINGVDYVMQGNAEGWAEWGLTLNGPNGAISDAATINLQRRGMITLDNTGRLNATSNVVGANNNNRIANDTIINMENGWLRINGGAADNTEVFGTVNINDGTNILDLYGQDGSGFDMDNTITTLNRSAGGVLRVVNLDATSTFSSTLTAGENARLAVTTLGATQFGGGGAVNTTTRSIVQGVFGGIAPLGLDTDFRILGFNNNGVTDLWNQQRNLQFISGSHFMTYDGGFLRPLDDDEYFAPADGILSSATPANQNVNLSDIFTIMKEGTSINALRFGALQDNDGSGGTLHAGTTLMNLVDHHAINLMLDGTLTITSGMISSAYFTVGNTASADTFIYGGALNFDGKEAIINSQNAFYRLNHVDANTPGGLLVGGSFNIRTAITNAAGLTKTGPQRLILAGANTYSGVTTISEGVLDLNHGRSALGAGGTGNGVVITGAGELRTNGGIVVGTPTAREDIYVGILAGDQQVMRTETDVTVWNSNLTIDNIDASGLPLGTPRIRTDNSATSIINGNIAGGNTLISNDVVQTDSRRVSLDAAGNNVMIFNGVFGDRFDGSGNAVPVADPVSMLPTLAGTRTNENEVLRVNISGASLESNYIFNRQYNSAGRLNLERGLMIVNYDPAAPGNDGTGFWTNNAISKIPNADSVTTSYAVNGGTSQQGFIMNPGAGGLVDNNGVGGLFLARAGQVFNMASWTMGGTGAKHIGGLNESGTVTFGTGTGSLTTAGAIPNLYAADGGTVVFDMRMTGNVGTAPSNFGFFKQGRGTVTLQNSSLATASDSSFVLGGGTLVLNHTGATVQALVGNQNARFDGGTLIATASSAAATTTAFATNDAADRVLNFSIGGTEIVARTTNTGTARNMVVNMGNANANGPGSNFTRGLGATANLVEDNAAGGTAQITLQFNASTTAAVKNQVIPWATYGTLSRTATDFAMSDAGNGNDVRAYTRALDEYNNSVATWAAGQDVSENGGAGFNGTLGGSLSLSTLRFDANADSTVNLGTNVLTLASTTLAQSGSALLVSSNVGSANKTITGGVGAGLTASGGRVELIMHHYGTGNLNVNVPITGAGVDLVIAGPSTTNAATIGTTGAVVLGATNTFDGQIFLNGSVLSFNSTAQLGTHVSDTGNATPVYSIHMNGGTLRYTGSGMLNLGATRGIVFNGNGGTIDVTDGAGELYLDDRIGSNAQFRGDLIKVGAGTLTLNGAAAAFGSAGNPGFLGLIDVRQGTLRVAGDHGNNTAGNGSSEFTTMLGSSFSYADGTIFRNGTNFAVQMGNASDAGTFSIAEWLTFEGNNYVSVGTINTVTGNTNDTATAGVLNPVAFNPNNERAINLAGVNTINGTVTFDVVLGQTLQLNGGNVGYTTGSGTIIKDGQGTMTFNTNNPDYTGNLVIKQGALYGVGQADPLGTGYLTGGTITIGSADRQGLASLYLSSDSIHGQTLEINHDINVVYNAAQTKRLAFETFANGSQIEVNGDITLNDNLQIYINDAAENGGSQNYVNFNGQFKDGTVTGGNLVLTPDEADGTASNSTNGRTFNYYVLRGDNSAFTGDVRVNSNTSYDQDQNAILRLEHATALTAANDVDMGFNSILQAGGGARTIGALSTNGGTGPFIGSNAGGTMGASTNGTTVVIENAAATAGTLTITQSTPASTEVQWNAHFRDGTLNSDFFAPGAGPTASAALNVVKAGNGWASITTDNAYTGTTTVTGGILQVGRLGVGDTGATTAAGLTANTGTTIAGTGVIQGNSTISGFLKPGDEAGGSMGTLTVNGTLTLVGTSNISMQVQRSSYTAMNQVGYDDTTNYGTWLSNIATDPTYSHMLNDPVTTSQHDKLLVTSSITSGGKVVLLNNGYNPTAGDIFNLIDWVGAALGYTVGGTPWNGGLLRTGAETGTDLDLFELGGAFRWDVSQFNTHGFVVVVVPEPSRMVLLLIGLLGLGLRRRRRSV